MSAQHGGSKAGRAGWLKGNRGFLLGLLSGAVVVVAALVVLSDDDTEQNFVQRTLYALSELAIDTEQNAADIVELRDRLDDLELALERLAAKE